MLLVDEVLRLNSRSTAEMTVDEMILLRVSLESSEAIKQYEYDNRPKRGGIRYGFVQLFLLYLYMECRKTTYRGVVRNLSDHECRCLMFPKNGGGVCRPPSPATLNHFVNHVLARITEDIGKEISKAVLAVRPDHAYTYTLDSTPMQASRYNFDADYHPHYEIRMDKAHMIMADGFPISMLHSNGHANDGPYGIPLVERMCEISPGMKAGEIHADGLYDAFLTYAYVYIHTGMMMRCNQGIGAVHSGFTDERIVEEYNGLWKKKGYDPHRKNDIDFMLRFLYKHGKEETVGMYLRDRSMDLDAKEGKTNARHVCETVHRAMKRWMAFDIFRIAKATKTIRVRCRFLCLQLLATLFKGYAET
jgi:hypothetical protein